MTTIIQPYPKASTTILNEIQNPEHHHTRPPLFNLTQNPTQQYSTKSKTQNTTTHGHHCSTLPKTQHNNTQQNPSGTKDPNTQQNQSQHRPNCHIDTNLEWGESKKRHWEKLTKPITSHTRSIVQNYPKSNTHQNPSWIKDSNIQIHTNPYEAKWVWRSSHGG